MQLEASELLGVVARPVADAFQGARMLAPCLHFPNDKVGWFEVENDDGSVLRVTVVEVKGGDAR